MAKDGKSRKPRERPREKPPGRPTEEPADEAETATAEMARPEIAKAEIAEAKPLQKAASRRVPDAIKRFVYERDGGRCTFVDEDGRRCAETGGVEIDHQDGFASTRRHDPERMRLLCRGRAVHRAPRSA